MVGIDVGSEKAETTRLPIFGRYSLLYHSPGRTPNPLQCSWYEWRCWRVCERVAYGSNIWKRANPMLRGAVRMIGPVAPVDAGGSLRGGRGKAWQRAAMLAMLTAMLTAWAMPAAGTTAARDPEPPLRIPLEPIGYQPLLPEFLLAGSPMLTVDFVDNDHLLITFGVRRLMTREPDPPADDDDRTIGAFLVELPSGKVLAQTEWREHDRWRYLWNLGHGRFLLRVRDNLTLLAPMEASDPANAFRQTPLLRIERHIVQVLVSWNSDLLTVETVLRAARTGEAEDENGGPLIPGDPAPVQLNFYRLVSEGGPAGKLVAVAAGAIRAHTIGTLPLTAAGFLDVLEGGKGSWMFNFDEHAGKVHELAEWDTSCFPRANFVGPGEFVAFGCRGSDDFAHVCGIQPEGRADVAAELRSELRLADVRICSGGGTVRAGTDDGEQRDGS